MKSQGGRLCTFRLMIMMMNGSTDYTDTEREHQGCYPYVFLPTVGRFGYI